ncbi:protein MIS12 homolog [Rhinatrema bivittatum]|uniref:protein MIS12 homolog n=1 Tax=Rhinatrema bivittatum TaxID=194408 RepID=UPI00112A07DD|nr:protein MIS12 homolog [Rhinatrema bivittatum]XP_029468398.1 protein MIS12 homolog [Rhinatrema bivittatum]XP_029468399.1 protein MIS12 homolog [Rhinatrema bivittatum]
MSGDPMTYETQFFGFTPQTCILRVYIAFQDYLFEVMLVVEKVIMKKLEGFPNCDISPFLIRESTEKCLLFMKKHFNFLFCKMEQMLLNFVLNIPENVLLPEDKVHEQYPYSKEEFQLLQNETEQLQQQCKAETYAREALLVELEEQKLVQAELEKILQWFDGLENVCKEHGNSDLKGSFSFLVQNSRKLQDMKKDIDLKSKKLKLEETPSYQMTLRTNKKVK